MVDLWPLTGRMEELRVISDALADKAYGGVVIAGPAGVGKTRLARAAADAAAQSGWTVRHVAGTATGRLVTLGAFARWADATDTSPLAVARKVVAALTADTDAAKLLVLVDDAHLLDDLSALIVHQLALAHAARVVTTVRTGEPLPDAVTSLWKDGLLRRMDLQPLARNESDDLLRSVLGGPVRADCTSRMWTLSRGNVLFLHHLVEHERDSGRLARVADEWTWTGTPTVSPSLVELVELQIGAVPEEVRDVVDLVAIAEPVDQEILATLAEPEAIQTAEERGLIAAASATSAVYVGHPLYGEIRLGRCGPMRLRGLRGRVATAMAQSGNADPLRLGLLWLESDLPPDVDILSLAATIASSRLDLDLAERLARAAHDVLDSPAATLQLAHILYLQEKGQAAEALLDTLDPRERIAPGFIDGVIVRAANMLMPLRNPERANAVIDEALQLGDANRNHSLYTLRAVGQAMGARPADAVETMSHVEYDQLDSHGRILGYAAETLALGDLGRAGHAGDRAAAGYRELVESPHESFHGSGLAEFHAYAMLAAGYVADADAIAERWYLRYADAPGMSRSMALAALGMTALGRGDLRAALRHLGGAQQSFGGYGEVSGLYYRFRIVHTEALARCGDGDAAMRSLEAARDSRHPAYEYVESGYLLASAWVAAGSGRVAAARDFSRDAAEFARSRGQLAREVIALQTSVQFGDAGGADRLTELATLAEGPRAPLAARYALVLAADDGAGLDAVSQEFAAMGDLLAAADAAAQAGTSHRRAGHRGSALTAGARADQLARDCGGAVSPALAASLVRLPFTRREHEIVKLVSDGLSNKAIAEAMSLSVRTVEGHIYQASTKAGVTSRSELSTLVQQFSGPAAPSKS